MDISDIQSEILNYSPIDEKETAILGIGSKESFFNDVMSYGISLSDIYKILDIEKKRRERLLPCLDTIEYKLITLLRKYINHYWEISHNNISVNIYIDSIDISEDIIDIFSKEGFIFVLNDNKYIFSIDVDEAELFYNRCILIDLDMFTNCSYNFGGGYKIYCSSSKY